MEFPIGHKNRVQLWQSSQLLLVLLLSCLLFLPTRVAQAAPLAQAPLPESDQVTTPEDTPILIDVLANDSETNGNPLTLSAVGTPTNGTAEIVANQVRYTPKANFFGRDSFFYTVHNGDVTKTRQATVDVTIVGSNDAPTEILLRATLFGTAAPSPLAENAPVNSLVGLLMARDPDLTCNVFLVDPDCRTRTTRGYLFTLTGTGNDNQFFAIENTDSGLINLVLVQSLVGRGKATYTVGVQVRDPEGLTFTQNVIVQGSDTNDPPTAITLSSANVNENLPAGARVGIFSSVDPDSPGRVHTYTLVEGSGSDDNAKFTILADDLRTATPLDFEQKPILSIRVRTTDNVGNTFEQILLITVNNLPEPTPTATFTATPTATSPQPTSTPTLGPTPTFTPSPTPVNTLSYCSGNAITLFEFSSTTASKRVLVRIDNVVISNRTRTSCSVNGLLTITTNGSTRSGLAFSGDVNARNQFSTSEIPDFEFNVAGIQLVARSVKIEYISERPTLHITRPELKMPREFGGLSAVISVPTSIDTGGVKFGTGTIKLPSIQTASGFALELSGSLRSVGGSFEIKADGDLTIPNIKKGKSSTGRDCTIGAGVTIFADAQGRTVLAIAAGTADPAARQMMLGGDSANGPTAPEALRLGAVRARASCDPGLPIGSTGLFLTSVSGEVTVIPGREQVDVEVEIQAGKSLPVVGPLVAVNGSMSLKPSPFQLDLGGTIKVLIFEMARADATIVTQGFKARIKTNQLFGFIPYTTDVSIAAFTRSGGQFTFAGSGRVAIEMKKGAFGEECTPPLRVLGVTIIPKICLKLPPFDLPTLAAARVEAGEFTNRTFGFKGVVSILGLGSSGFFVNDRGSLTFRNVDSFKLVTPPFLAAARAAWQEALKSGQVASAAAAWKEYTFLQDAAGNNTGVIVDVPLVKPMIDLTQVQAAGATDVISQVNLIRHGDVLFNLMATEPLGLSLFTPDGQEVTPANYAATVGYDIDYTQYNVWGAATEEQPNDGDFVEPLTDDNAQPMASLLFTAVSSDPALTGLDLRIDNVTIYFDLDPQDTSWLTPLKLTPGAHTLELRKHGTTNVVLQSSLNLITDTHYSLISYGGAAKGLALLTDDNAAPATMGKAKVRFINAATPTINMVVNGMPVVSNLGYLNSSEYLLLAAGSNTIEFRNSSNNALVSTALTIDLADGGVYTFFATDDVTDVVPGLDVRIIQRTDARYAPVYYTTYSVDQALMNQSWKVKVTGDTDNVPFQLSVNGPDSPPILGSVTVDASNLAATQVSWQLTSDINPTKVQIYVNPQAISASFTVTNADGSPNTEVIPLYEGQLLAEFEMTSLAELGGQLVTKVVDLSKLPSGTYHLWVRADDGINPPATSYAAVPAVLAASATATPYGFNAVWLAKDDYQWASEFANATPIIIDQLTTFPTQWTATITPTFDATTNALNVEWQVNRHPDADSYQLLVGHTPLAPTEVITVGGALAVLDSNGNPTGVEVGFVRVTNIRPDLPYFLSIEAIDSESGRTVRSQEVQFSVPSTPFALTSSQPAVAITAGGKGTVPVTLNASGALFFPNVWLSTDLGNTPLGITAKFANDTEGFPGLNPGAPTRQLEISVDSSVPNGIYPIVISGYNGEVKEVLTLQVTVSGGGSATTSTIYLPMIRQ
ncbi:MAG: DUF4397 domain-containing protein [Caldilineaceae bacterium]|nr:DUF4397 domain-containing protein [Caldilineaceae bacterium]